NEKVEAQEKGNEEEGYLSPSPLCKHVLRWPECSILCGPTAAPILVSALVLIMIPCQSVLVMDFV
ncbi:hypothetical protein KIPB_010424, partial [Kipferlia bialata]